MSYSSISTSISVHPMSNDPTTLWKKIKNTQKVLKIQPPSPKGPPGDNKVCNNCFINFSKFQFLKIFD